MRACADKLSPEAEAISRQLSATMDEILSYFEMAGMVLEWKAVVSEGNVCLCLPCVRARVFACVPACVCVRMRVLCRVVPQCECVCVCASPRLQMICCGFRCLLAAKTGHTADSVMWAARGVEAFRDGFGGDYDNLLECVIPSIATRFVVILQEAGRGAETVELATMLQRQGKVRCRESVSVCRVSVCVSV